MDPILRLKLLDGDTANGEYEGRAWRGTGVGSLHVYGTFDGATVTIEGSTDGGDTWTAPASSAFTSATLTTFEAGRILVRAKISSAGASTDLNCDLVEPEQGA